MKLISSIFKICGTIGQKFLKFLSNIGHFFIFFITAIFWIFRPPWYFKKIFYQIIDIGYFSLPVVGLTTFFSGMVLALQTTAMINRFMRATMLDNLNQDYVRTARAKGLSEWTVVMIHVLRNSMIPVITVIALNVPAIFGGAIITEQVFKVNGIGQQLIGAIYANDLPTVQTITFMFAVLIVLFNLLADIIYGILDPRIRYD